MSLYPCGSQEERSGAEWVNLRLVLLFDALKASLVRAQLNAARESVR